MTLPAQAWTRAESKSRQQEAAQSACCAAHQLQWQAAQALQACLGCSRCCADCCARPGGVAGALAPGPGAAH
jgi:hypothetical protein